MQFKWHLIIGLITSLAIVYLFNLSIITGLIIFLSSWLIDIDHYFWYSIEMKDWSPMHAISWYKKSIPKWHSLTLRQREEFKRGAFIFHGIIFWAVLLSISFLSKIFLWIFIGVMIHMIMDWVDLINEGEPLYNKIFPFMVIRRNKNKKGLGEL